MHGIADWLGFPDDVIETPAAAELAPPSRPGTTSFERRPTVPTRANLYQRVVMLLALDLALKNGSQ